MNAWCAQRIAIMGFTRFDPKTRRVAMCAASVAAIGFVGSALIGHSRRVQDNSPGSASSVVQDKSPGSASSVEQSQQAREDGLPQPSAVGPEPADAAAAESPRRDALGV